MELSARRERTTGGRKGCAALGVAAVLAAAMLTGCGSKAGPTASGSPAGTPTGSASSPAATPTPSATHPTGRNPSMTDAEALARMTDPQTGEHWFGTLKKIAAPAWARSNEFLGQEWTNWYELGTRGAATIVGAATNAEVDLIFEREPDGSYLQIDYPSPRESGTDPESTAQDYGVAHDRVTYYDSFAMPEHLALPSGDPLEAEMNGGYGVDPAGDRLGGHKGETASSGGRFGSFEIVRYDSPGNFVWTQAYPEVASPTGLSYENWYYLLRTPWATEIPLWYRPFGAITDVTWDQAHPVPASDPASEGVQYLTDLNDSGCGDWDHDHVVVVRGLTDADWVAAGTNKRGQSVYLPTKGNHLLATMYRLYAEHSWRVTGDKPDGDPLNRDEFVLRPGLVAYKTPSTGSWVVFLNGRLSARAWC